MEELIKKELTEQQLKSIDEMKKEKLKDTAQEEIEKGNHIVYPFTLNYKGSEITINNKQDFLRSRYWSKLKWNYIKTLRLIGKEKETCECCGKKFTFIELQLHHLTYKNIGNENFNELIYLCFNCHKKSHNMKELSRKENDGIKKFKRKNLLNFSDLILFGKYKEEKLSLKNLIDKDKRYVLWLIENNVIRVNKKVEEYLKLI